MTWEGAFQGKGKFGGGSHDADKSRPGRYGACQGKFGGGSHDADKSRPGRYGACQGKFGGGVMMQIKGD